MERGRTDNNIRFLDPENDGELAASAAIPERNPGSEDIRSRDTQEDVFPELADHHKTILVPVIQTMKDYILLHYKHGIAAELCCQIADGEVATGYDIDDIQVIPLPKTCRFRHMSFWRASASSIIADIDVGIDLLLQDGIIDDTVNATFRVALHIDMDEGEILECDIYGESEPKPERGLWQLSDYLVPILRKDEIEAGAEALLGKYYPEALCDLKVHNAFEIAERMGLRVMTLPLYKRPRTKSVLFFCEGEVAICVHQETPPHDVAELVRIPENTIVINSSVIPADSCHMNIYHECIHFDWHYLFYRLQDMYNNDAKGLKTRRVVKTEKLRGANPLLWMEWQARRGSYRDRRDQLRHPHRSDRQCVSRTGGRRGRGCGAGLPTRATPLLQSRPWPTQPAGRSSWRVPTLPILIQTTRTSARRPLP